MSSEIAKYSHGLELIKAAFSGPYLRYCGRVVKLEPASPTGSIERLRTVGIDTNGAQRAHFSTLSRLFRASATGDSLAPSRLILDNQRRHAMGDERKRSGDRRTTKERRSGKDTRSEEEKRLTGERRSQVDRRSGEDRRAKRSDTPKTK